MKPTIKMLACLSLAWAPLIAHAQIYICKDASGHTITSDRVILECANRPMREVNQSGVTTREIPAPLTAEQKRQKQQQDDKRKADEEAALEQRRQDQAIVERYRNEADIDAARTRTVSQLQDQIKRESGILADAEKQLKDAQGEAEIYKIKKKSLPSSLKQKIGESTLLIKEQKKTIEVRQTEITQANARYDNTLKRFREVTGQ